MYLLRLRLSSQMSFKLNVWLLRLMLWNTSDIQLTASSLLCFIERLLVRNILLLSCLVILITSPPEGVARYCFHPVCLFLCVCLCVCVFLCVCPANIVVFHFSAIRRDIDLKFIQDTYWVVLNSLKKTFIGQRSRSQGRYIAFWRYSHITKTEP